MSYNELSRIANGKYTKRLDFLHLKAKETPVEEFYLLINTADVEKAANDYYALWAYRLEALRNGLILVPVFLTWFSLGLAALAYVKTYTLSPDAFLKQWADGFPQANLPFPTPNFIEVAAIDAFLILLLILLTSIAQIIEIFAHKRTARICSWLDEELYKLAASSLVKSLGDGSENKQPAWAVEVHTAINHLNQALAGVKGLVDSSQQTLQGLVRTSHVTLQNLVEASQQKLEGSVREFRGAIHDQREAVEKFMSGTVEVRRAVDKLEKIYVEGEHIYQGLNATLPKMDASFKTMATRQDEAATALETISGKTSQATNAIGSIASQFTQAQLVQSTYQAAIQMKDTADMMRKIAIHMRETIDRQTHLQIRLEQQANYTHAQPVPERKSWFPFLRKRSH